MALIDPAAAAHGAAAGANQPAPLYRRRSARPGAVRRQGEPVPDDRRRRARARSARGAGLGRACRAAGRWSRSCAPTASSRPTSARWCGSTSRSSSSRTAGARPAASASAGATSTTELFEPETLEPRDRRGAGAGAGQSRLGRRAGRRDDGAARPGLAGRAAARGDRPRAGGRFQPQGHSAPFRGRIGERVAAPGVTVVDDGTLADRRGSLSIDDEGTPTQRDGADRGRHPQGLYAGPPQRAADGRRADRQRPARKLRARADAADDQHLHEGRQRRSGRAAVAASRRASSPRASAAGRSTSCRASSCSAAPRRTGSRTAGSARRSRARR